MSLGSDIKDYALSIGYDYAGITDAEGFPDYLLDLKDRYEMYQFAIDGRLRLLEAADPKNAMPAAKSIVVVAIDYYKESFPERLLGKIGRYYLSRCQPSKRYSTLNQVRHQLMEEFLANAGCQVVDNAVLPERLLAARAGIAQFGKNNFVFGKDSGSFIVIASFIVDTAMEYDQPAMGEICPEDCTLCLDACPTGALYEPYKLDPRKCIALYTFSESRLFSDRFHPLPPRIRERMGGYIFGCDICQEACPRNKEKTEARCAPNAYLASIAEEFKLTRVLNMDEDYFQKKLYPILYNYLNKKPHFQRNAAIALGNLADPETVFDLAEALKNQDEIVRAYSAWALGRIGGREAMQVLGDALSVETSELVIEEIKDARASLLDKKRRGELCQLIL